MTSPALVRARMLPPLGNLRTAARDFLRYPSPRLLLLAVSAGLVLRVVAGGWSAADLYVAAGFVAAQPFTEWLIHVYILHFRPRRLRGRVLDPAAGRSHRRHHQEPRNPRYLFIHIRVVQGALVLAALGWWAAFTSAPAWGTAVLTSQLLTVSYEWIHYLIHSDYVPRSRWYKRLWRLHRLHHFRNENYWMGVTMHLGDRVLGTYPDKDAVPLSTTATTMEHLELA